MKCYKSIIVFFFLLSFVASSQNSEIGIFGGTSYYLGELNPSIQVANKIRPALGVFYRKNISKRYALRAGINYAKLAATDQFSSTELSQYRQLSFSTNLFELYGVLEFNFIPYEINNYTTSNFTPYVFIGGAAFFVNPSTESNGSVSASTEGAIIAPSIPFGLGIKFNFAGNLGLAIEWGVRKTFTDQIDGLSDTYISGYQLSNTQNNDWYSMVGITLNYKFLTKTDHCPGVIN
ncbi:MAG: hypothetical protein COA97_02470 [Flavobacteriales bacterium]|nr:MAG: hypothetical protein COA97_02470 [Flavobacteriales bacterium]